MSMPYELACFVILLYFLLAVVVVAGRDVDFLR